MISNLRFFCLLLLVTIGFSSCSDQGGQRRLPRFSGEPGEILVIMNENDWLGNPGDSLRSVLEKYYPELPQGEPSFKLLHFAPNEMSHMLEQHRNILRIVIGAESGGESKIAYEKNKWSNGQLYFKVLAPNEAAFDKLLRTDFSKVTNLINTTEIARLQDQYRAFSNDSIEALIKTKFGFQLTVPKDCEIAVNTKDFLWLKRERVKYLGNTPHDITQGFFIYSYPYTSDSAFTPKNLMTVRDTMLETFVPGPKKGTFMTTEYRLPPISKTINLNDRYTVFTRGLWKTENYFMGGPFLALSTTSNDGRKIISVSGFVFAPRFHKREYVREVEAVLKSIKFPEKGK